jgi:hypothetical protein
MLTMTQIYSPKRKYTSIKGVFFCVDAEEWSLAKEGKRGKINQWGRPKAKDNRQHRCDTQRQSYRQ